MPWQIDQNIGGSIRIPIQRRGGFIDSCSIVPALPESLKMIPQEDCTIRGHISNDLLAAQYTLTGSNHGGTSTLRFNLHPDFFAPYPIYSGKTYRFDLGRFKKVSPLKNLGGPIKNCKLSRRSAPLPEGLVLNLKTCVISGIATVESPPLGIVLISSGDSAVGTRYYKRMDAADPSKIIWQSNQLTLEVAR
jgi:hypothetical protein